MKKNLPIFFLLTLAVIVAYLFFFQNKEPQKTITNFEECVAAGNPVMESYPAQCRAEDKVFAQNIGNEIEKMEVIRIIAPRPNETITSPLVIRGNAKGNWFFEASFPVSLYDANGKLLTINHVQAQEEDWMTEEFVYFESKLIFEKPTTKTGTLILEKSNASGLPENDDRLEIPVIFN